MRKLTTNAIVQFVKKYPGGVSITDSQRTDYWDIPDGDTIEQHRASITRKTVESMAKHPEIAHHGYTFDDAIVKRFIIS